MALWSRWLEILEVQPWQEQEIVKQVGVSPKLYLQRPTAAICSEKPILAEKELILH